MKKDMVWKVFLSDDRRFADLVNGILFQGAQAVVAQDLAELDTQTGYIPQPGESRKMSGTDQEHCMI